MKIKIDASVTQKRMFRLENQVKRNDKFGNNTIDTCARRHEMSGDSYHNSLENSDDRREFVEKLGLNIKAMCAILLYELCTPCNCADLVVHSEATTELVTTLHFMYL